MENKEETINALRALSNIEWYVRRINSNDWISEEIGKQFDIAFDYIKINL